MTPDDNLCFGNKNGGDALFRGVVIVTSSDALLVCASFWKTQTEDDEEDWGKSGKPVVRSPSGTGSVDESSCKRSCEEIAKRITLLEQARHNTTSLRGAVFESSSSNVAIKAAHSDAKESTNTQELFISLTESSTQLQDNEEGIVNDKGPFTPKPVRSDTKDGRSHETKHEDNSDTPVHVRVRLSKLLCEGLDGQGDSEVVKGIPGPGEESNLYKGVD